MKFRYRLYGKRKCYVKGSGLSRVFCHHMRESRAKTLFTFHVHLSLESGVLGRSKSEQTQQVQQTVRKQSSAVGHGMATRSTLYTVDRSIDVALAAEARCGTQRSLSEAVKQGNADKCGGVEGGCRRKVEKERGKRRGRRKIKNKEKQEKGNISVGEDKAHIVCMTTGNGEF